MILRKQDLFRHSYKTNNDAYIADKKPPLTQLCCAGSGIVKH